MHRVKTLFHTFRSRIRNVIQTLTEGPLGWGSILLVETLFYLFYFFQVKPGMTLVQLTPIGIVGIPVLFLGAWLKGVRGALLGWFLMVPSVIINAIIADGGTRIAPAHQGEVITLLLVLLASGLIAGHFSSISHRLVLAYAVIQKQALTDAVTGLPNHRAIVEQLERELDRARRSGRSFSLIFFDADHFKHVNDTCGHAVGDVVLYQIGERAGSMLRSGDTLGRFGGEEFVLLLPDVDANEALAVAERVRAAIATRPMAVVEVSGGLMMSVSIGVATYPEDADGENGLLSQADEAMYMAKRLGRNQVCRAGLAYHDSVRVLR